MVDEGFIRNLGIIITAAAMFALATRQLRVPTIVGYLLAGVFLGPITHLVANAEAVSLISEVGIVLLLFLVGLELDFAKIRDLGKRGFEDLWVFGTVQFLEQGIIQRSCSRWHRQWWGFRQFRRP